MLRISHQATKSLDKRALPMNTHGTRPSAAMAEGSDKMPSEIVSAIMTVKSANHACYYNTVETYSFHIA